MNMCVRNFQTFSRLLYRTSSRSSLFTTRTLNFHTGRSPRGPALAILCCNKPSPSLLTVSHSHPSTVSCPTSQLSSLSLTTSIFTKGRRCFSIFPVVRANNLAPGFCRFYSSQKTNDPSTLTSDILKSKLNEQNQNENEPKEQKDNKDSSGSGSNKKDGKYSENSWFHAKHAWKLGLISLCAMSLLMCGNLIAMWGGPILDPDGKEIEDEFTPLPKWQAYPKRAMREAHFFKTMIQEPSYQKLLPDPLKEPWYQPPYTLVIELTGVLVHPDWTLGTGWRFKKRPAVSFFLQQVASPVFEVVIFTKEQGFTAFPIIDGLDPNGHVTFRLFRDATRYMNGAHVKDLENLNRDLSKIIVVDCEPKAVQKQPRNALMLKTWKGTDDDRTLVDLAAFLKTIAVSGVDDVRPVLEHYSQFDDPLEAFKENQRRLQGEQDKTVKVADQAENRGLLGFGRSFSRRR